MTHSFLQLLVYAMCIYRLSRLLAVDDIFEPFREFVRKRGFVDMQKTDYMGSVVDKTTFYRNRFFAWFFNLISCMWCNSVWIASVIVAVAYFNGHWFIFVCLPFAFSAFAGIMELLTDKAE